MVGAGGGALEERSKALGDVRVAEDAVTQVAYAQTRRATRRFEVHGCGCLADIGSVDGDGGGGGDGAEGVEVVLVPGGVLEAVLLRVKGTKLGDGCGVDLGDAHVALQ